MTALGLQMNSIGNQGLIRDVAGLSNHLVNLTALDLSKNGLKLQSNQRSIPQPLFPPEPIIHSDDDDEDMIVNDNQASDSHIVVSSMHKLLAGLPQLQRLDLSNNRLTGSLRPILEGLTCPLQYLNLCACSLSPRDIEFLSQASFLKSIRELDLSENELKSVQNPFLDLLTGLTNVSSFLVICRKKVDHAF